MGKPQFKEIDFYSSSSSSRGNTRVTNWLIHTQEGNGDAESLAGYLGAPRNEVSYHYTGRNRVVCNVVDTDRSSWSVGDANPFTINFCFAGSFASWSREQWLAIEDDIEIAAWLAVEDSKKYGFSTEVIVPPYGRRRPGISDHEYVTQVIGWGSHTDVGPEFPWDVFTRYVDGFAGTSQEDDMATAAEIAAAVWETKVPKPGGGSEQAGILLGWTDKHTADTIDQLAGPKSKDQRDALKPTGWPQLTDANRTTPESPSLVDGLATRADVAALWEGLKEIKDLITGQDKS